MDIVTNAYRNKQNEFLSITGIKQNDMVWVEKPKFPIDSEEWKSYGWLKDFNRNMYDYFGDFHKASHIDANNGIGIDSSHWFPYFVLVPVDKKKEEFVRWLFREMLAKVTFNLKGFKENHYDIIMKVYSAYGKILSVNDLTYLINSLPLPRKEI